MALWKHLPSDSFLKKLLQERNFSDFPGFLQPLFHFNELHFKTQFLHHSISSTDRLLKKNQLKPMNASKIFPWRVKNIRKSQGNASYAHRTQCWYSCTTFPYRLPVRHFQFCRRGRTDKYRLRSRELRDIEVMNGRVMVERKSKRERREIYDICLVELQLLMKFHAAIWIFCFRRVCVCVCLFSAAYRTWIQFIIKNRTDVSEEAPQV